MIVQDAPLTRRILDVLAADVGRTAADLCAILNVTLGELDEAWWTLYREDKVQFCGEYRVLTAKSAPRLTSHVSTPLGGNETETETPGPMLTAALSYAARGWKVFPCAAGGKIPLTAHGFLDASADPDTIKAWWAAYPSANVAIATGTPGPDVLDLDLSPGDEPAFVTRLDRLAKAGYVASAFAMAETRSGGLHLYYAASGDGNHGHKKPDVDFRGAGGYVLAPPSYVAADEKPGGAYRWHADTGTPRATCRWQDIGALLWPAPPRVPRKLIPITGALSDKRIKAVIGALTEMLDNGDSRHNAFRWTAQALAACGVEYDQAFGLLEARWHDCGKDDLRELERTIQWGQEHPLDD